MSTSHIFLSSCRSDLILRALTPSGSHLTPFRVPHKGGPRFNHIAANQPVFAQHPNHLQCPRFVGDKVEKNNNKKIVYTQQISSFHLLIPFPSFFGVNVHTPLHPLRKICVYLHLKLYSSRPTLLDLYFLDFLSPTLRLSPVPSPICLLSIAVACPAFVLPWKSTSICFRQ